MGACSSTTDAEERAALERSKQIDRENQKDFMVSSERIKILLLGAGDSGKSTIFKQMRRLYGEKYSDTELMSYKIFIHQNIVETMEQLCLACVEMYPNDPIIETDAFKALYPEDAVYRDQYRKFPELTEDYVAAIKKLWQSTTFQNIWKQKSAYQINDSSAKFLNKIDEISAFTYMPSEDDIVLARIRTTGIREERLKVDDQIFQFFDVGGQRNERRKWIHCFEGVHGVMFVTALSEYDQRLFEEHDVNRMAESIDLFEQIVNEQAFTQSAMILFLNKSDLYDEKIKHVSIKDVPEFSDYSGPPNDRDKGIDYFVNKFMERNSTHQEVFRQITCATDKDSINVVFNACKAVIIRHTLEDTGFVN